MDIEGLRALNYAFENILCYTNKGSNNGFKMKNETSKWLLSSDKPKHQEAERDVDTRSCIGSFKNRSRSLFT